MAENADVDLHVPDKMMAAVIHKYGGTDVLMHEEVPVPKPGPRQVLVRVHAASVNPIDVSTRNGKVKMVFPYELPLIMGYDMSGMVVANGAECKRFEIGTPVYGAVRNGPGKLGTLAEYVAIDEDAVAPKPPSLAYHEAASLPVVALTTYQCLVEKLKIQKGEKLLITCGAGGVGTFAIQYAKHVLGAYVVTTASERNAALCKQLGADEVIDYKKTAFEQKLKDFDAVLDATEEAEKAFSVLKQGGRCVSIAGNPPADSLAPQMAEFKGNGLVKWISTTYLDFAAKGKKSKAAKLNIHWEHLSMVASGAQLEKITEAIEAHQVHPVIDTRYPLAEAKLAFATVEGRRGKGKVVVDVLVQERRRA